jgi:hypothetical protein
MYSLVNINKFRNDEILDQDNKYNKEAQELARKLIQTYQQDNQREIPDTLTPADKAQLDRYINGFKNALDDALREFYEDTPRTNVSDLINRYNFLVIYFNQNISRSFANYLNSNLQDTETLAKLNVIKDWAKNDLFSDRDAVDKLVDNIRGGVLTRIPHVFFTEANITSLRGQKQQRVAEKQDKEAARLAREQKRIDAEAIRQQKMDLKNAQRAANLAAQQGLAIATGKIGRPKKTPTMPSTQPPSTQPLLPFLQPVPQADPTLAQAPATPPQAPIAKPPSTKKGKGKSVKRPLKSVIKEHKNLVNVLQKGSKSQRMKESVDQNKELQKYLKMSGKGLYAPPDFQAPTPSGYATSFPAPNSKSIRTIRAPYVRGRGKVRPNILLM